MMTAMCKDVDPMGCDYNSMGGTKEEVAQNLIDHATKAHPEMMKDMTPEKMEGMRVTMMSKVHEM